MVVRWRMFLRLSSIWRSEPALNQCTVARDVSAQWRYPIIWRSCIRSFATHLTLTPPRDNYLHGHDCLSWTLIFQPHLWINNKLRPNHTCRFSLLRRAERIKTVSCKSLHRTWPRIRDLNNNSYAAWVELLVRTSLRSWSYIIFLLMATASSVHGQDRRFESADLEATHRCGRIILSQSGRWMEWNPSKRL